MDLHADLPVMLCASSQEWENRLVVHHAELRGVWLKIAKKGIERPSVSYADARDGALCYGWIDGQKKACDEAFWLQTFTPRRPTSLWSRVNTEKATQLIAAGRMTPAGRRDIERAKADGRWDAAYGSQQTLTLPEDFQAELDRHPQARAFFRTLNKTNRYAICFRIETAKKPQTRQARIETFLAMLARNEKLHP